jgi:hypothetical protein
MQGVCHARPPQLRVGCLFKAPLADVPPVYGAAYAPDIGAA